MGVLLEIGLGDYTLSAVRHGDAPPPGSNGATFVRMEIAVGGAEASLSVGASKATSERSAAHIDLPHPILGENSVVSLYLDGPVPSTVTTEPRSDSAREIYSRRGFQHYQIRYRGAVGEVMWRWDTPVGSVTVTLECFPTKLDYRNDYAAIRNALEALAPSLTASAAGAAAGGFDATKDSPQASEVEWLQMVQRTHTDLRSTVNRLLPGLRRQIQPKQTVTTRDRMRRAKPVSKRAYGAGRPTAAVQVSTLVDAESSPVNGHLKWELERLRATALNITAAKWFTKLDPNLRNPIIALCLDVDQWLRRLRHIPTVMDLPNLQVRLRDPLYEAAFRCVHSLRFALQPLEQARPVGLKDLPTLYEYWVFLRVVEILKARFPIIVRRAQPAVQRAGADLVLTPGKASEIILTDESGMTVACQFNRLFTGLPTTNQRPDAVIEIRGGDRLLLIDAKYRLGRDPEYMRRYAIEGPLADDINVIHRYRDAIVAKLPPHRRLSHAGLIAYPGKESSRYLQHQFYRSWLSVRVGGIPMLPSATGLMEQTISDYLDEICLEGTA
ncbi:DUF2357 domain-containing protein [Rhodococcus gannanensis]|uniref:DUF2357 domain-containing protein n=1 Tax=Rhodococcus gannanensis TaxID=1960308 RepID=A0ABW4P3V8_9NOCA